VAFRKRRCLILAPENYILWLGPGVQEPDRLQALLRPFPAEEMTAYPVNTKVDNPANDTPRLHRSPAGGKCEVELNERKPGMAFAPHRLRQ